LVLVGGRGWFTGDIIYAFEHDPEVKDQVQILSGLSDGQLAWLYQNCRFTIYPSVYEGWGLPIAESLAYGKLCLPSSSASMTEIAGDLLEYYLPHDAAACLDLITKYLDPETLRAKEASLATHFHSTNWRQTYDQFSRFVDSLKKGDSPK
jgi:glycosyltransferase involved in cell wall biosynthesis